MEESSSKLEMVQVPVQGIHFEDWNSGWKVVFKTHTCQQLWKKKGFYLAHLSGLLVLVWIKRAQERSYA